MKTYFIRLTLLTITCLLFVTCSSKVGVIVRSTQDLNNGGNPVVVRIYQLKSAGNFQRATVESFWESETAGLGSELMEEPVEIVLHPNERRKIKGLELNEETAFIGVAADFYQPDMEQWKSVMGVSAIKGDQLVLAVGDNGLLMDSIK